MYSIISESVPETFLGVFNLFTLPPDTSNILLYSKGSVEANVSDIPISSCFNTGTPVALTLPNSVLCVFITLLILLKSPERAETSLGAPGVVIMFSKLSSKARNSSLLSVTATVAFPITAGIFLENNSSLTEPVLPSAERASSS